jgi:hypothetical protein
VGPVHEAPKPHEAPAVPAVPVHEAQKTSCPGYSGAAVPVYEAQKSSCPGYSDAPLGATGLPGHGAPCRPKETSPAYGDAYGVSAGAGVVEPASTAGGDRRASIPPQQVVQVRGSSGAPQKAALSSRKVSAGGPAAQLFIGQ